MGLLFTVIRNTRTFDIFIYAKGSQVSGNNLATKDKTNVSQKINFYIIINFVHKQNPISQAERVSRVFL